MSCMLVQEVPVLPVLAKADCMTTAELESFREHVRTTLHHVSDAEDRLHQQD